MVRHAVPRAVVRAALGLLGEEGLLRPGPTGYRIVARRTTRTGRRHGHGHPPPALAGAHRDRRARRARRVARCAGRGAVPAHRVRLGDGRWRRGAGDPLRDDHGRGALLAVPGTGPFDQQLTEAGLHPVWADTRSGPVPADPDSASLLGVAAGAPLLGAERTLTGGDGRVLAVSVLRADPTGTVTAARDGAGSAQSDSSARTVSRESASAGVLSGR